MIDAFNESKVPLTIEEVGFVKNKNSDKIAIFNSQLVIGSNQIPFRVEPYSSATYIIPKEDIVEAIRGRWGKDIKLKPYVRDSSGKKHYSK